MSFTFKAPPYADKMDEPVPSRLTYVKSTGRLLTDTPKSGDQITNELRLFWDDRSVNCFIIEQSENWELKFSAKPGAYFSFSWALSVDEIDILRQDWIISMGFRSMSPKAKRPTDHDYLGRILATKGRRKKSIEHRGAFFEERHQVSFGMQEDNGYFFEFAFFDANKVWIDFIITNPRYKNWIAAKPQLWMQEINNF